ncbi:MAG: ATP-binding protein [Planctomycetota bacterium]
MSPLWLTIGFFVGVCVCVAIGVPLAQRRERRQVARTRAAERRARAAERMAAIGQMTGGLAHEIKNPLSTIGLNAQLIEEAVGDLDIDGQERTRLVKRLGTLRRESERLRDTLTDFLRFAGEVRLNAQPADLNDVVEEIADFYAPQAQHHKLRFRHEAAPKKMPVRIDTTLFKQALLNLLINATQAMEAGTGSDDRPRELMLRTIDTTLDGAPACAVHVIDTGPGIPADTLAKIFTPYYTTKSGGNGLGLPTTQRLVEEHGGLLEVHSDEGVGTDFAIILPRA